MGNQDPQPPEEERAQESAQDAEVDEMVDAQEDDNELARAEQKAEDNWNLYVRAQAELDNHRKRAQRDVENAHKFGLEKLANELLAVRDSLEMGLSAVDADAEKLREGTELTLKMLTQAMEKFEIQVIDPQGEVFDPNLHQAMSMVPSEDQPANTVVSVMQKGYMLYDRLLRPAMVVVAK